MTEFLTHLLASDVAPLDKAGGNGPAWVKLTPRGAFTARDGREFDVTPETLVQRFNADGVALPIDIDHATVKNTASGTAAPAVGWIEELQARDDGLYGRVVWLDAGMQVLNTRSHRYLSPALKTDGNNRAVWLHSAGLVTAPGISMPSVAAAQTGEEDMKLDVFREMLGLASTATPDDIISEVARLKAVETVSSDSAVAATNTALQSLASGLATDRLELDKERRASKVERAIERGMITPALRATAMTLLSVSEQHFDTFCSQVGGTLSHLFKPAITDGQLEAFTAGSRTVSASETSEAASVARTLGIDRKALD